MQQKNSKCPKPSNRYWPYLPNFQYPLQFRTDEESEKNWIRFWDKMSCETDFYSCAFVRSLAHSHWKPNWVSLNLCSQTAKKWRCHFRPKINRYIQKQLKGQMLADISYDLLWSLIKGHRLLVSGLCVNALGISCVVAVIVLKGKCNFWNIELYLTIKLASWVLKSQRLHKTLTSGLCFS